MTTQLPTVRNAVTWKFRWMTLPIRIMNQLNIGPFGGENSVSAVIEGLIASRNGTTIDFPLSKTEAFLISKMKDVEDIDGILEYRELNHEAQQQVLDRWGHQTLGVIWIGAGVFTLAHPLLLHRKPDDWHIWTDANPKVMSNARTVFDEMRERGSHGNLSYDIMLPQDVDTLNRTISFLAHHGTQHICIFCYGVNYILTMQENVAWLSKLRLPDEIGVSFVFNGGDEHISPNAKFIAAVYRQPFYIYNRPEIDQLFRATVPRAEVVWERPRTQTPYKAWETWLIYRPPATS